MYHYSDPTRESEPMALPDVDVFHSDDMVSSHEPMELCDDEIGYYYAFGFPGCMWDSEPVGPFDTQLEALKAARGV